MWVRSLGQEDSPGVGNGNLLQYSCLEIPTDRGGWQATVYGVTESWTRLSDFTFFFTLIHTHTHTHTHTYAYTICIWASLVAQLVKKLPAMWETWVQSLGWEHPLEKGKATNSSILAWRIPWTLQSMGSQRVGHD